MSLLTNLLSALAMQATLPEPGTVQGAPVPVTHSEAGFMLTLPPGWRYTPMEDGSGLTLVHASLDARIEAFAVATEPAGIPGLPDDSVDALALRLEGPGFHRTSTVRVALAMAGETGDRQRAGEMEALSYSGEAGDRRWSGVAATRCGADIILALDSTQEAYGQVRPAFEAVTQSWALILTGGSDFPCAPPAP